MASGLSRSGSFAPSTLSVLYENQAMKVEREELKSELKLISARVRILNFSELIQGACPQDHVYRHELHTTAKGILGAGSFTCMDDFAQR